MVKDFHRMRLVIPGGLPTYSAITNRKCSYDIKTKIGACIMQQTNLFTKPFRHPVVIYYNFFVPSAHYDRTDVTFCIRDIEQQLVRHKFIKPGFFNILDSVTHCEVDEKNPRIEVQIVSYEEQHQH